MHFHQGLHYTIQGSGNQSLVFLHYWGGSTRTWQPLIEQLPQDIQILCIDLPGWGLSEDLTKGETLDNIACRVRALIEKLALPSFTLVGHSMGGKVAQLIAAQQPKGLASLILVAPAPACPMILTDSEKETMIGAYQSRESLCYVIENVLTYQTLSNKICEQVMEDSLGGSPEAKAAWPSRFMHEDIREYIRHIQVPCLVISGQEDRVDPPSILETHLLPYLPSARLITLPNVGHLALLEAPNEMAKHIHDFLNSEPIFAMFSPEQVPLAFDQAFNRGNINALLALFCDEAIMRMADGEQTISGKSTLKAQFEALFQSRPNIHNRVQRVLQSHDTALVIMDWTVTVTLPDGEQMRQSGTATQVMRRHANGHWQLLISNPLGVA